MSEHATQIESETSEVKKPETETAESPIPEAPPTRQSSLPIIFSALALLLAGLALAANLLGNKTVQIDPMQAINTKLGQIENRIGDVELQMTNDKLDVVDTQLKHILMNLKQLSRIADDATRERINRAYRLLEPLASSGHVKAEIDLQSTIDPENNSLPEAAKDLSPLDITSLPEDAKPDMPQPAPDSSAFENQPAQATPPATKTAPAQIPTQTNIP